MGSGKQKLTSPSLSNSTSFICPLLPTLLVYIPHPSIQSSPQYGAHRCAQLLSLQISHTHLMLQTNLALHASLTVPHPLPHPCRHSSCCRKCPPPASPCVKPPSTLMAYFRLHVPWSLPWNPRLHHLLSPWSPWHLVCAAVSALVSLLLMLRALVNLFDLVSYSVSTLRMGLAFCTPDSVWHMVGLQELLFLDWTVLNMGRISAIGT